MYEYVCSKSALVAGGYRRQKEEGRNFSGLFRFYKENITHSLASYGEHNRRGSHKQPLPVSGQVVAGRPSRYDHCCNCPAVRHFPPVVSLHHQVSLVKFYLSLCNNDEYIHHSYIFRKQYRWYRIKFSYIKVIS